MRKHVAMIVLALAVVVVLLTATVAYRVDELNDIVLVKTFNKVTAVKIGSRPGDAGLHFKWPYPFQRIVRYDQRTQVLQEDSISQATTADKYTPMINMFCSWRITDPERFNSAVEDMDKAVSFLRDQLRSSVGNVIGKFAISDLINTDPAKMKLADAETRMREHMQAAVGNLYGVQVVKVGFKSLSLPSKTTEAIINLQKEERNAEATMLEKAGQSEAEAIRSRAATARETILAFAERKAAEIRSRGMEQAAEHYKKFRERPELAMYLRTLESLQAELQKNATIVLDAGRLPGVKWLQTNKPDTRDLTDRFQDAPAKPEPAKTEPAKAEPAPMDPARVDAAIAKGIEYLVNQQNRAKAEPGKTEPKPDEAKKDAPKPTTQPATSNSR